MRMGLRAGFFLSPSFISCKTEGVGFRLNSLGYLPTLTDTKPMLTDVS